MLLCIYLLPCIEGRWLLAHLEALGIWIIFYNLSHLLLHDLHFLQCFSFAYFISYFSLGSQSFLGSSIWRTAPTPQHTLQPCIDSTFLHGWIYPISIKLNLATLTLWVLTVVGTAKALVLYSPPLWKRLKNVHWISKEHTADLDSHCCASQWKILKDPLRK